MCWYVLVCGTGRWGVFEGFLSGRDRCTVTKMRDKITSLTAHNGGLRNELETAHKKLSHRLPSPTMPTPPPSVPSKRKQTGSQSPHQPTKQAWDTPSPYSTQMHSKHGGPSVTSVPVQPPDDMRTSLWKDGRGLEDGGNAEREREAGEEGGVSR
jgi:hypothetical protein